MLLFIGLLVLIKSTLGLEHTPLGGKLSSTSDDPVNIVINIDIEEQPLSTYMLSDSSSLPSSSVTIAGSDFSTTIGSLILSSLEAAYTFQSAAIETPLVKTNTDTSLGVDGLTRQLSYDTVPTVLATAFESNSVRSWPPIFPPPTNTAPTEGKLQPTVTSPSTYQVEVGAGGANRFSPQSLITSAGDKIIFIFLALNHTLTESTFEQPCTPKNGFDTGFIHFNPGNTTTSTLEYVVQSTNPQYFYCAQTTPLNHCRAGMVFALNPRDDMKEFGDNLMNIMTSYPTGNVLSTRADSVQNSSTFHFPTPFLATSKASRVSSVIGSALPLLWLPFF